MTARVHFALGAPLVIIGLVTLVLFVFVLVDMVRRPSWQWQRAGSNKAIWITLEVALFVLFGLLSVVSGIVYLVAARPKLVAAENAANYSGGYGGVPPSWQPDPSGRHQLRYWDGTAWTEHVSDAGSQSTDPVG